MNVFQFCIIVLSISAVNAEHSMTGIDYRRCIDILNKGIDYSLNRFLGKELYRRLPDADLGKVKLNNMLLSGLNTIHRRCDFQLTYVNETVRVEGCIGADQLRISMDAKGKLWFIKFTVHPGMIIRNFNLYFRGSVRMVKGETVNLEALRVDSWDPKLKFSGKMAIINWVFNLAMKTALKDLILKKVMEEVVTVVKDLMKQNPL